MKLRNFQSVFLVLLSLHNKEITGAQTITRCYTKEKDCAARHTQYSMSVLGYCICRIQIVHPNILPCSVSLLLEFILCFRDAFSQLKETQSGSEKTSDLSYS